VSTKLLRVMERAKRDPEVRFTSLAHLIDEDALVSAYRRLRKKAAVGVDGVSVEAYGQHLARNLRELHDQLRNKRYRHKPIRRVFIPKEQGKTRPIGISSVEDKIVQEATRRVLEAVYEPIFRECSYGFRPKRGAHDALRALYRHIQAGGGKWILEADIQSFFDSIDRTMLMEMLREKIADPSLLRLVSKCLRVGVLEGEEYSLPEEGTVQGSVLSPLLGNIYLHHVLDLWFERDVLPRLKGKAHLIRYADDFVIRFDREDDAKRVMGVLGKRFQRFGLTLHPDKTRLLPFQRPPRNQLKGKGPASFDFLGFTVLWQRARGGFWRPGMKTRKARLRRAIERIYDWCRDHRHWSVKEQHAALKRRLQGHFNYFGVSGNHRSLEVVLCWAIRAWRKWLRRRSQKGRLTWERFVGLLRAHPLPTPRIRVRLWGP
jgi:RNA-directed DNA polymerase